MRVIDALIDFAGGTKKDTKFVVTVRGSQFVKGEPVYHYAGTLEELIATMPDDWFDYPATSVQTIRGELSFNFMYQDGMQLFFFVTKI